MSAALPALTASSRGTLLKSVPSQQRSPVRQSDWVAKKPPQVERAQAGDFAHESELGWAIVATTTPNSMTTMQVKTSPSMSIASILQRFRLLRWLTKNVI